MSEIRESGKKGLHRESISLKDVTQLIRLINMRVVGISKVGWVGVACVGCRERETTARLEDARPLAQRLLYVSQVFDDVLADDGVEGSVAKRQRAVSADLDTAEGRNRVDVGRASLLSAAGKLDAA